MRANVNLADEQTSQGKTRDFPPIDPVTAKTPQYEWFRDYMIHGRFEKLNLHDVVNKLRFRSTADSARHGAARHAWRIKKKAT